MEGGSGMGGLLGTLGIDGPWDVRRILGTVPIVFASSLKPAIGRRQPGDEKMPVRK
jgi:hypothetical protein